MEKRAIQKIRKAIELLDVDLSGLTVLTEVGSNEYAYSPVIARMCGAEKVFAWTRDTRFGSATSIINRSKEILNHQGLDGVEFYMGNLNTEHLSKADIITNSGFLRPLNEDKLKYAKPGAVIPLMYEKWEYRSSDVDAEYCIKNNIPLAGTWENHPDIMVFEHVGPLAVKMAMEAGYEVYGNHILVWSDDHFGELATKFFLKMGAKEVIHTINNDLLYERAAGLDFVYICDYSEERNFGSDSFFNADRLLELNPALGLVHLFGNLETEYLKQKMNVYPDITGKASTMTYTLTKTGLTPYINLQVAGYKVALSIIRGEAHPLVQLF
jgi:hypothetical protein